LHPVGTNRNRARLPDCSQTVAYPESHTRNPFYFESIATLQSILTAAGLEVRIGSLREDLTSAEEFSLVSGRSLVIEPIQRNEDVLQINDFLPCAILLNNDLSSGVPDILKTLAKPSFPTGARLGQSSQIRSLCPLSACRPRIF